RSVLKLQSDWAWLPRYDECIALWLVDSHSCGWSFRFHLRAHFLDLRGLLFELCCENSDAFLELAHRGILLCSIRYELSDGRLLFFNLLVLFQKLVEQHRVHLFVAPIRIVFSSPATPTTPLPISILLFPAVRSPPAIYPNAVF